MAANSAVRLALDLSAKPALARAMRLQPVPSDVLTVIRIAAGDGGALARATAATDRDPDRLRKAAALYLQQVLLGPGADSCRVLGLPPDATREQAREHMRWLMKWLHPDRTGSDWDSVFAARVLDAWREVSSAGTEGDAVRMPSASGEGGPRGARRRLVRANPPIPWIAIAREGATAPVAKSSSAIARRAAWLGLVALAVALGTIPFWGGADLKPAVR